MTVSSVPVSVFRTVGGALLLLLLGGGALGPPAAHAQKDFEEWRKQQRQKYQQYLDRQDKAFLKFLKRQWKNVDVKQAMGSPVDDKPAEIPTVGESGAGEEAAADEPQAEAEEPSPTPANAPSEPPPTTQDAPPGRESAESGETDPGAQAPARSDSPQPPRPAEEGDAAQSTASVRFFGVQTSVPFDPSLAPSLDGAPGKEAIRTYWQTMAAQNYEPTLEAVQARREELGLSDWGYYVYLRDLGTRLYQKTGTGGGEAATLWTWFMMMQSGYAVRVGYRDDNVFLLLPVNRQIYNRPQIYLNDQRYYLMVEESGGGSLRTYEGQHAEADRVLTLDERILPRLEGEVRQRTASFSYNDERFNIEFSYDTAVLRYLKAYPNVELSVLFQSGVSSAAQSSLTEALRPHLKNRSARDALTFLLRFVQFATEYKRDRDNFGEERYLFPEESLAVSASDCEDRAVLFSYLVRTLLDRPVVGLKWPSHVATAVKVGNGLTAASDDRTLTVDGATYVMADPTYIGSSLGMEMPFVEGKDPDIITFAQN